MAWVGAIFSFPNTRTKNDYMRFLTSFFHSKDCYRNVAPRIDVECLSELWWFGWWGFNPRGCNTFSLLQSVSYVRSGLPADKKTPVSRSLLHGLSSFHSFYNLALYKSALYLGVDLFASYKWHT